MNDDEKRTDYKIHKLFAKRFLIFGKYLGPFVPDYFLKRRTNPTFEGYEK